MKKYVLPEGVKVSKVFLSDERFVWPDVQTPYYELDNEHGCGYFVSANALGKMCGRNIKNIGRWRYNPFYLTKDLTGSVWGRVKYVVCTSEIFEFLNALMNPSFDRDKLRVMANAFKIHPRERKPNFVPSNIQPIENIIPRIDIAPRIDIIPPRIENAHEEVMPAKQNRSVSERFASPPIKKRLREIHETKNSDIENDKIDEMENNESSGNDNYKQSDSSNDEVSEDIERVKERFLIDLDVILFHEIREIVHFKDKIIKMLDLPNTKPYKKRRVLSQKE